MVYWLLKDHDLALKPMVTWEFPVLRSLVFPEFRKFNHLDFKLVIITVFDDAPWWHIVVLGDIGSQFRPRYPPIWVIFCVKIDVVGQFHPWNLSLKWCVKKFSRLGHSFRIFSDRNHDSKKRPRPFSSQVAKEKSAPWPGMMFGCR